MEAAPPQPHHEDHAAVISPATVRLPIDFFAMAVVFFAAGVCAAPFIVGEVVDYFYQARVLALVHTFTLGWVTATMMGVMYRYVPALTRRPLRYPRLAVVQFWTFLIATCGMVAHFAIGSWPGTWSSAAVMLVSIVLFAVNILLCLAPQFGRGVAETGMAMAVLFLVAAATLGLLLALDKTFPFLPANLLTNIGAHAHLAAVGWMTLTICAASYRFIPAFLLPHVKVPSNAVWMLYGLAAGTAMLGAVLLAGAGGAEVWAVVIAVSLMAYIAIMARIISSHRMPIDWTARHAIAGIVWLVITTALGLHLAWVGPATLDGNRIASAYGALGLFGWITNFIVGMSYQLFPAFVTRVRTANKWRACTIAQLSVRRPRLFVFVTLNVGITLLAFGLRAGSAPVAQLGTTAIAAGGLCYAAVMLWALSFAYRAAVPA